MAGRFRPQAEEFPRVNLPAAKNKMPGQNTAGFPGDQVMVFPPQTSGVALVSLNAIPSVFLEKKPPKAAIVPNGSHQLSNV